ncbi:MAG: hypothetical protein ABI665_16460 [Vicinamibacterales bacterium]
MISPSTRRPHLLLVVTALLAITTLPSATSPKFYPDDPLLLDIEDRDASNVRPDEAGAVSAWQAVRGGGDRSIGRAMNVNSIDEVPDSSWFTNRIGSRESSLDDITRGPNTLPEPVPGPWTVVAGKVDGVTPGLQLADGAGRRFFVKFDPPSNPEMASGAEIVATKLLFALGFNVPENYIINFSRDELVLGSGSTFKEANGSKRPLASADVDRVLARAARRADGSYRALASLAVDGRRLGPFQYAGVRPDDPNDIVPHEHRRELRALRVFAAWLNHVDTKSQNSLDTLVDAGPRRLVRHYLIDFGSALGSAATAAKGRRDGYEYGFDTRTSVLSMLSLGAYTPSWVRIRYPRLPAIGRIEGDEFRPEIWKPTLPNAAFQKARPDDTFWAAERVMSFTDEAIRAAVATARFTDPAATQYLGDVLIKRRNRIGRAWLTDVNPIAGPAIDDQGFLTFRNAAQAAGLTTNSPAYGVRWNRFDNATHAATPLESWTSCAGARCRMPGALPAGAEFVMAEVAVTDPQHPAWAQPVRAYFRAGTGNQWTLAGFERSQTEQ